ncbi:Uncharacterized protein OS=Burkholderia sp. SJ98 GN=BURK_019890 PE=4 SV=1: CHAT [Gemmata massiliana]|uniref:Uncharacterized protein n=1 Tax=Gemmata massiliana TaxID=1210884 RepID=A0A6P2CWD5_9BACT|nr:CHAT domain-containing protein [Gemmata massiliana]VTR92024.1 Uncharacterized protein OS=Burkholderia sp. SJ98 GN=BURK_019890 PE=4 SV=1: CHAT [Gemmata massiliana]
MIRLEQVATSDFFLLRAADSAGAVAKLLATERVPRVVIRRDGPDRTSYFVFPTKTVLARCAAAPTADLQTVLDLHAAEPVPLLEADGDAETSPDICLTHRDGVLLGLFDADLPVTSVRSSRNSGLEATGSGAGPSGPVVRHVHADFPDALPQGETASLLVSVRGAASGGAELPIATTAGLIDVVISPMRGFELVGRGEGELLVADADEPLPLQFKLRATELGPGRVKVFCFQKGVPLGAVTVHATVLAPEARAGRRGGASVPLGPAPPAAVDLTFLIEELSVNSKPFLRYTLLSTDPNVGLVTKRFAAPPFQQDPQAYFRGWYAKLDQRIRTTENLEEELGAYGADLFKSLFPDDLRALLWSLRDRIKTVQVVSEESWVPWELVQLSGPGDSGRVVDGPFLCRAFRMTRWVPDVDRRAKLTFRRVAVVAPDGSDLVHAPAERDHVLGLAVPDRRTVTRVPAERYALLAELRRGEYDGWHFVGHAKFEPADVSDSRLELEGKASLCAIDVAGAVANCGAPAPLVFLNGCQTGQAGAGLTGAGGWARRFIDAGAAVFVGTLWSVRDESAAKFAKAFYNGLLGGKRLADAVHDARAEAGTTGLAYTVFADPFAEITPSK